MDSNNFIDWQQMREYYDRKGLKFQRKMQITESLIRRLGLEAELEVRLYSIVFIAIHLNAIQGTQRLC